MSHPPLAPDHVDAPHRVAELGDLRLESGESIVDYRQSFVTHGAPNADRSNAILVCPALTATHHRLDFLIGAGKALDPARWFVVVADPIGNGLSTSPSNSAASPACASRASRCATWSRRSAACSPSTSASIGSTRWSVHRWAACRRCSGR